MIYTVKQYIERVLKIEADSLEDAMKYAKDEGPWSAEINEAEVVDFCTVSGITEDGNEVPYMPYVKEE